ncbi:hypothetical protein [Methylomonas sp. AM2-LC]|uniref:hypothetical protein n=1 Tax=Methylomonas sp. AM2-LC TaxID=3153301 RepID=UPI003265F00D
MNNTLKTVFFTLAIFAANQANAYVTYTDTDNADPRFTGNVSFAGSFTVDNALADGTYHFASVAAQPAGFKENFFTASFIDGSGVTRTPTISVFDITITNAQVSAWSIEATSPYTRVTRPANYNVYHAAVVTYLASTTGDTESSYDTAIPYQSTTFVSVAPGTWSVGTFTVPLPSTLVMFVSGLLGFAALTRKQHQST